MTYVPFDFDSKERGKKKITQRRWLVLLKKEFIHKKVPMNSEFNLHKIPDNFEIVPHLNYA